MSVVFSGGFVPCVIGIGYIRPLSIYGPAHKRLAPLAALKCDVF